MEGAKWSKLIYLTAQFPTESLVECGSFCQTETPDRCDLYAIKSKSCHVGKFENPSSSYLATQSGTNPVYVNFGNVQNKLMNFNLSDFWTFQRNWLKL